MEDDAKKTVRIEPPSEVGGDRQMSEIAGRKISDLYEFYAVQAKIGDGGMGVVYLAKDRRLGRFVAVKRLNNASRSNPALRRRFLHEARAAASLNHIHIVHIYSLGEDSEGPFIVMEYVAGPDVSLGTRDARRIDSNLPPPPLSLASHVTSNGQYTINEAVDLLIKISKAISYAHQNGVIHRDLKPENILLDETGEPKVVDFGLARLMGESESKLTVPGEKLLSLGYGAPEQENDASNTDERADVYALGALLYFAITGQNPRYYRDQDIPVALREVLSKALAMDREQRWKSAAAFLEALIAVQSRTRVEVPPAKTTWRCKWCDTVNPLSIRFCSECGWDGTVLCPECSTENIIGNQFCGSCGADIRLYEGLSAILRKMEIALESCEFERVLSLATRTQGFDPAGIAGQKMLQRSAEMRRKAEELRERREQLREFIPIEMRAENYERAKSFIEEFRKLNGNAALFTDSLEEIPERIVQRDIAIIRRAMSAHDWKYALKVCTNLLENVTPNNQACIKFRRQINFRIVLARALKVANALLIVVLLYVLSLPIVARFAPLGKFAAAAYAPARVLYEKMPLKRPLGAYAKFFGVTPESFVASAKVPIAADSANEPEEIAALIKSYKSELSALDAEAEKYLAAWPEEYAAELKRLMERCQSEGNYEGLMAGTRELARFESSRELPPPSGANDAPTEIVPIVDVPIVALRDKFQKQIADKEIEHAKRTISAAQKTIEQLQTLKANYTKRSELNDAERAHEAIQAIRASQTIKDAQQLLAQ